jgi:hypothetical protein
MKFFLILIGMVVVGFLGYSLEPQMRYQLTGKRKVVERPGPPARVVIETPATLSHIDPASYPADQLPQKVVLKADAELADAASDLKLSVTAGNRVDLVRLEGQNVVISPGAGPFEGRVPILQTDLLEQLAALPKQTAPASPDLAVTEANPAPEPVPELEPEPVPLTEPEMEEEVAAVDPEPAPAEAPEPAGSAEVVSIMQASVKAADIKEFTFEQVLDWEASAAPETIDGETYQTGVASYKAETVFGVKTIQAKALIKDNKVERWIWPKSGMEIK